MYCTCHVKELRFDENCPYHSGLVKKEKKMLNKSLKWYITLLVIIIVCILLGITAELAGARPIDMEPISYGEYLRESQNIKIEPTPVPTIQPSAVDPTPVPEVYPEIIGFDYLVWTDPVMVGTVSCEMLGFYTEDGKFPGWVYTSSTGCETWLKNLTGHLRPPEYTATYCKWPGDGAFGLLYGPEWFTSETGWEDC